MNRDQSSNRVWQPRFYAACALSATIATAIIVYTSNGGWWGGFAAGYGAASVLALLFLAVQHWSLATPGGDAVAE